MSLNFLIGAILGVGLAHAALTHVSLASGINWGKALEVGASLLCSPLVGLVLAGAVVEKLGAKLETSVCGVIGVRELLVMTAPCVVVPTNRCLLRFKSSHACMSRGTPATAYW